MQILEPTSQSDINLLTISVRFSLVTLVKVSFGKAEYRLGTGDVRKHVEDGIGQDRTLYDR